MTLELYFFATLAVVLGAPLWLTGYRYISLSLLCNTFLCGGLVGYTIVVATIDDEFLAWTVFLAAGLVSCNVYFVSIRLALFSTGAVTGMLLIIMINTLGLHQISSADPNRPALILFPFAAVLGGAIVLRFERPVIIASMAFTGSFAIVWGIGQFAGQYPGGLNLSLNYEIPSVYYYLYCPLTIVLAIVGALVQHYHFANGVSHDLRVKTPSRYISRDITYRLSQAENEDYRIPSS